MNEHKECDSWQIEMQRLDSEIDLLRDQNELLRKALIDWLDWEAEQVKKYGPYVAEKINQLITAGRQALLDVERLGKK